MAPTPQVSGHKLPVLSHFGSHWFAFPTSQPQLVYLGGSARKEERGERMPYRDPDRALGQIMLTVRDALGLTQSALAEYRGASRRALGAVEGPGLARAHQ